MKALRTIRFAGALLAGTSLTLIACASGDDAAGTGNSTGGGQVLTVTSLDSLKFDPPSLTATAGEITFEHVDAGSTTHTFLIDGAGLRLVGDESGTIELEPGEYVFYCDVPGHREAGMEGTLTVTP